MEKMDMATIRFGSNIFSAKGDFTIVGVDASDNLVLGAFGAPPTTRLVWVTFNGDAAFLNADLADADGEGVLQIRDNVITLNKNNIYRLERFPDNQIPPDQVVVTNQYGETALDLRREGQVWDFNGDFYHRRWHIVATPQGTAINPSIPNV
jgi:hypothetical protein